jgi:hypothetical protein
VTLLFVEGYEDQLTTLGKYISGSLRDTGGGRSGGTAARPNGLNYQLRPADESDTLIVGLAFQWDGADQREFLELNSDGGVTTHLALWLRSTGQIVVRRGGGTGATVVGTTAIATPLISGVWHYMEIKAKLHDTTGTVDVRIDEVSVLSLTGQDTKNGGTKTVFDRVSFLGFDTWMDDVYVANTAGAVNNNFLGDCVVETLLPTGNGNSSVLVGSDGNSTDNYLLVDEATPNTSDYVGSAVSGDKDTYAFGDITHTSGSILGVHVALYAAKTDAGARKIRSVVRSAGTDYGAATDQPISTTYAPYLDVRETDPATAAAWTGSAVNAAEFGAEVRP